MPRFSVILPTHDRDDVIGFAIRSVLAQTDGDLELQVVGDGCTDGTARVVAEHADPRVRWFDLPKAPAFGYANRNVALREARGELLAFVAHDDLILPDHLQLLGTAFDEPRVEWAYTRPVWVADDGTAVPFATDLRQPDQLDLFLHLRNTIPASCVMYRRACVERYGEWPEDVEKDGDWVYWRRIIGPSGGANLGYVPAATALHFRADWRSRQSWGPPPLGDWLRVASQPGVWPTALRWPVPEDTSPQGATWQLIEADPSGWPARLRVGISEVMDLMAWSGAVALPRLTQSLASIIHGSIGRGDATNAIAIAEQATDVAPHVPALHVALGMALLAAERPVEAETALLRAVELDPLDATAHAQLGRAVGRLGRTDEALAAARHAVDLEPGVPWLRVNLAYLLRGCGALDQAEAVLTEALRLDPGYGPAAELRAAIARDRSATGA